MDPKTVNCGKDIFVGSGGSLTGWIFQDGRCQCKFRSLIQNTSNQPVPDAASLDLATAGERLRPKPVEAPDFGDQFEVIARVGEGGMGTVHKVRRRADNETIAIKVLRPEQAIKRFEQEVKAASLLAHPNLVAVHQFGRTHSNAPYMVMDFIEGESLAALLARENRLSLSRTIKIMFQVCEALTHAHSKGIIHRDLKPTNIMLSPTASGDDDVKLVDFGIAKVIPSVQQQTQNLTQSGEIFGSPLYMSPEQCTGQALDARSDIYSIGCVMYECLSGQPPFAGDNIIQTILKHVLDVPQSLIGQAEVTADTDQLVMRCLKKDPRERYQSTLDLMNDLYWVALNKPLAKISASKKLPLTRRAKLIWCAAVTALVAIVLASVTYYLSFLSHTTQSLAGKPVQLTSRPAIKYSIVPSSDAFPHAEKLAQQGDRQGLLEYCKLIADDPSFRRRILVAEVEGPTGPALNLGSYYTDHAYFPLPQSKLLFSTLSTKPGGICIYAPGFKPVCDDLQEVKDKVIIKHYKLEPIGAGEMMKVQGTINFSDGKPASGAVLQLVGGGEAVTDARGHYALLAPTGDYDAVAQYPGAYQFSRIHVGKSELVQNFDLQRQSTITLSWVYQSVPLLHSFVGGNPISRKLTIPISTAGVVLRLGAPMASGYGDFLLHDRENVPFWFTSDRDTEFPFSTIKDQKFDRFRQKFEPIKQRFEQIKEVPPDAPFTYRANYVPVRRHDTFVVREDENYAKLQVVDVTSVETNATGASELQLAARRGDITKMKKLLTKANVNEADRQGSTALFAATLNGHYDAVKFLLAHGANPLMIDGTGKTARDWAVLFKFYKIAQLFD